MKIILLCGGELSQSVGETIGCKLAEASIDFELVDTKGFQKEKIAEASVVCIIMQTVENDQPPESAQRLVSYLKKKDLSVDLLKDVRFAVIGLGDSNLLLDRQTTTGRDCNKVAQTLNKRMGELGGTMMHSLCEADERTGLTEVDPWIASFVKTLLDFQ